MSIAALIRSMAEAGAPAEAIAIAVEAIEGAVDRQREGARERKRRQRQRDREGTETVAGQSRDTDVTVTASPSPSPSPQTPQPRPHPRGDITTRARESRAAEVERQFAAFWAAYPRRVGKADALKAFRKALSRIPDDDPLSVILGGIERALAGWDDPQFIPHPATWLNRESWTDEAPPPRQARTETLRHDRQSSRTAKSDHLEAVARAMVAACDGDAGQHRRDPPFAEPEDRGGGYSPAA